MRRVRINIIVLMLCVGLPIMFSGCKKAIQSYVPLPIAWPRLPLAESDNMKMVENLPVKIAINECATYNIIDEKILGLTVTYPKVNTQIYYTFIPVNAVDEIDEVIDSRLQRITLNLNGADAKTLHGSDKEDNQSVLVVATSGTQTPVQLLASVPGYVISATSFVGDPKAATTFDSIRPLVDMLEADMRRTLPGFNYDNTND